MPLGGSFVILMPRCRRAGGRGQSGRSCINHPHAQIHTHTHTATHLENGHREGAVGHGRQPEAEVEVCAVGRDALDEALQLRMREEDGMGDTTPHDPSPSSLPLSYLRQPRHGEVAVLEAHPVSRVDGVRDGRLCDRTLPLAQRHDLQLAVVAACVGEAQQLGRRVGAGAQHEDEGRVARRVVEGLHAAGRASGGGYALISSPILQRTCVRSKDGASTNVRPTSP